MAKKQILIYADDSSVRKAVINALGTSTASDIGEHQIHEFATAAALRSYVDNNKKH